jgi:nucleoside-diphosphate-sugar epimerase
MDDHSVRSSPLNIPAEDLQRCHDVVGIETWRSLAGQSIFMTGGTGFIGKWLLATLLDANKRLGLDCKITVLSRDPATFLRSWPGVVGRLNWVEGDVRSFSVDKQHFDVIIHAATDVVSQVSPLEVFSTCLDGTRRVLEVARQCQASRLVLISSGAVYGPLPDGMTHVPETYMGGPDPLLPSSAYGEGKRVSEWLCCQAATKNFEVKIARVFALVGPHLPLDKHFAIGNFLQDAMAGKQIVIQGDGTPHRSYLYAADMAAWLWSVLIKGHPGHAYNVGSDVSISIRSLAERVCYLLNNQLGIRLQQEATRNAKSIRYVPAVSRSRHELNLPEPLDLDEAILRTIQWHSDMAIGNTYYPRCG